ncbi:MAG: hypothetical protein WC489_04975 [Patescibacteria group bacterium]
MAAYCVEHPSVNDIRPWSPEILPAFTGLYLDTRSPQRIEPTLSATRDGLNVHILKHIHGLDIPSSNTDKVEVWRDNGVPTHIHATVFPSPRLEVYDALSELTNIIPIDPSEKRQIKAAILRQILDLAGPVIVNDHAIIMGNFLIMTEEGLNINYESDEQVANKWIGRGKRRYRIITNPDDGEQIIEFLIGDILDELLIYGISINARTMDEFQVKLYDLASKNALDENSIHELVHTYIRLESTENISNLDFDED